MYQVSSNNIVEELPFTKDGDTVIIRMEYGSGWVVINDDSFKPRIFKDQVTVSDFEWEDHTFEDNDGIVVDHDDESVVEEVEAIFNEGYHEAMEEAGWEEQDPIVTFYGFEVEKVD